MIVVLIILLGLIVAFPLFWRKWLRQDVRKVSLQLGLSKKDIFEERFYQILDAFLTGYNESLSFRKNREMLRSFLDFKLSPYLRGFAYEGTAMGFGAQAHFKSNRGASFEKSINELDPNHVYQYYVGLGWWLHQIYRFRARGYQRWIKQLNHRYASILFDGVGFKAGIFNYKKNPQVILKFASFAPYFQRVCYQGFGRSLWFQKLFNINEVLLELEKLPEKHIQDTVSGVGLAVAYSMFDDIEYSLRISKSIPQKYQVSFFQGMSFGWEARRLQNQSYWDERLSTLSMESNTHVKALVNFVHQAKESLDETIEYYPSWMSRTRELISESSWNEGEWE